MGRFLVKELICEMCGKPFERTGYNQRFCGSQKIRGSCSDRRNNTLESKRTYDRIWRFTHPDYFLNANEKYQDYRRSAQRRGIAFDLTREQFIALWGMPCAYCGIEIKSIGIDRVNPFESYNENNILPCCYDCNRMKNIMTKDQFIAHCRQIANNVGG